MRRVLEQTLNARMLRELQESLDKALTSAVAHASPHDQQGVLVAKVIRKWFEDKLTVRALLIGPGISHSQPAVSRVCPARMT